MADNKQIAVDVLAAVGGKDNVTFVTNCMTRLRFTLKDNSLPNREELKKVPGVLGCQDVGGQLQIIIGQNVTKVYKELCELGGFAVQKSIQENLDAPKEKMTVKKVFSEILSYLSASMVGLIPIMCAAGLVKALYTVLGPDLLGLITVEGGLYQVLDFVYDAGFYFMPIFAGYTAAKKLGVTPVLGMFMGAILIAPDFVALATAGTSLAPLGIPMTVSNYSQTVLPILLSIWIMSYVEKFFKKVMPDSLSTIFVPFGTILVMIPLSLYILAPLGGFLGSYIGTFLYSIGTSTGFVGIAIIAMSWEFLVMSGMHVVVITTAIMNFFTVGVDECVLVGACLATFAAYGMALGAAIATKNKQDRATNFGMFISGFVGGVTEPVLFGVGMKYIRPFLGMIIGAGLGGVYAGLTGVKNYMLAASNFLGVLGFVPGGTANMINGIVAAAIAMIGAAVATVIIGLEPRKKK